MNVRSHFHIRRLDLGGSVAILIPVVRRADQGDHLCGSRLGSVCATSAALSSP